MGYSVDVIAFDFDKFKSQIIPAFKEGESNSLIKNEIEFLIKDSQVFLLPNEPNVYYNHSFHGLKEVMATFDDSLLNSNLGRKFAVLNGQIEYIDSYVNLPSRKHWGYYDLCSLFEYITIKHCAKYYLNIGKQYSLEDFIPSYSKKLLTKLDKGCNFFQHGDGGFGEGITGWLNEAETNSLLHSLKIISILNSFKKIFFKPSKGYLTEIRIEEFIQLTRIAASEKLGILSGRDLHLTVPNRQGILKLEPNNLISGGYINFNGEIVFNSTYNYKL